MSKEMKIQKMVAEMTLEEKVSLLSGIDLWHTVPLERLGIPQLKVTDGPNGARGANGNMAPSSVCTPVGVALAATWNPELVEKVGEVLGQETKAKGAHILLAPTVNIHRSPLAGRNFECYSEDPYLTSQMAVAYIKGLQSQGVGACIKHFVANDSEFERMSMSSEVAERPLRELYLYPFRIALRDAQPWTIMSSYNRINGIHASENRYLLLDILKGEWGFDGLVISDWLGTYSPNIVLGGLDLEMPGPARWTKQALDQVKSGTVSEEVIDDKVRRLLLTLERVGAFEKPVLQPEKSIDKPEHRALMRKAAGEAIVLLKNDESILPLDPKKLKKIAVIGPNAVDVRAMGGGSSEVTLHYVITPVQGIESKLNGSARVEYAPGVLIHRSLPLLRTDWLSNTQREPGFTVDLFDNTDLIGEPVLTTSIDRMNISWTDEFLKEVDSSAFSTRLAAVLTVPASGQYKFGLNGNGRYRFSVDGNLLLDNWSFKDISNAPPWETSGNEVEIYLEADRTYPLEIQYACEGSNPWRILRIGCLPPVPTDLMDQAVNLAKDADVVILVVGLTSEWEREGFDRVDMKLPGKQDELITKIAAVNPNTIVVLNNGSPLEMPWLPNVKAVVHMWYPGQEVGNALADVLFGDVNPSGKLPTTFPKRLEDNPAYINYPGENGKVYYGEGLFVGYRYYDKKDVEPLFPFGFGLSYTTFDYDNLKVDSSKYADEGVIVVQFDIKNSGKRAGSEIAQVYIKDVVSSLARPPKELKGFAKIHLEPGEAQTVEIKLDNDALAFYDPKQKSWVVEPGIFEVFVGSSSQDLRLAGAFTIAKGNKQNGGENPLHVGMTLGQLLGDEKGKAVLEKHLPELLGHPQLNMAMEMTLEMIALFDRERLSSEVLAAIDRDLRAV